MYQSEIPTKLDRNSMTKEEWRKARTQELYDMLPLTTLEERMQHTEIRDEIIELNYSFFGFVASTQVVTDPMARYEDKLQSALMNFCDMWAKYKFTPKYRADLSFAVFFRPRLSECIRREFNIIKYSLRRTVCMKAAKQLGKPWTEITKDDIQNVNLSPQDMRVLETIFNTRNNVSYEDRGEDVKLNQGSSGSSYGIEDIYTENYDSLEDLIVHEMIEAESKLSDADLLKMSELYGIPFKDLQKARPIGEEKLKNQLEELMDIQSNFSLEDEDSTTVSLDVEV